MAAEHMLASPAVHSSDAKVVTFAVASVAVLLSLLVIYVVLPGFGIVISPPASYGILMTIAIYFSAHILCEPKVALLYAPLFILLATSVVPQSLAGLVGGPPPEYYFWAVGLFFMTSALVVRLPWVEPLTNRARWGVPLTLLIFAAVNIAASFQGLRLGCSLSYVARQFFGSALFIVYFYAAVVLAITRSDVARYFRILKWFGIATSLYAIICYAGDIGSVGSFKWGLSTYCAMLAVYCVAEAATAKTWPGRFGAAAAALLLVANPVIFQARSAAGIAAVAGALAFVMLLKSGKAKAMLLAVSSAIVLAAIALDFITPINSFLPHIGNARSLIPANIMADPDFIGRANQLLSSVKILKAHPLLGGGLGSTITYFDPNLGGVVTVAMVDQGFAYIMSKLGILGMLSFTMLVLATFWRSGWPRRNRIHIAMFSLFVFSVAFVVSHPMMLQFIGAAFAGVISGLLYRGGGRGFRKGSRVAARRA